MADSADLLSKGRRNLACSEISQAVENFQKACELLAKEYGDLDDRLADPNLLYGTALLELARMESTVIGNALEGVPEGDESSASENECDVVEKGPEMTAEEKEDLSNQVIDAMCETDSAVGEDPKAVKESDECGDKCESVAENVDDSEKKQATDEKDKEATSGDEGTAEEAECVEEGEAEVEGGDENVDGEPNDEGNDEGEEAGGAEAETEEEDVTNLQLAWEVIEVARKIFSRKEDNESRLKVADCYEKLGEISREKEDYAQAISDLQECLTLRLSILPEDSRELAETHFQIGTTHAVAGSLEDAVSAFESAITTLKKHASNITASIAEKEKSQDVNELELLLGTLKEVEALIPEIEKRKEEVSEDIQMAKLQPGTSANSTTTTSVSNGAEKPADDISHLVRKKRVVTENAVEPEKNHTETNGDSSPPKTKKIKVSETDGDKTPNGNHNAEQKSQAIADAV